MLPLQRRPPNILKELPNIHRTNVNRPYPNKGRHTQTITRLLRTPSLAADEAPQNTFIGCYRPYENSSD